MLMSINSGELVMEKESPLFLKIKILREKKGLSQDRFGSKIGVSGKSVSAYENGRCTPPLRVLENISRVYNVPAFYIGDANKSDLEGILVEIKQRVSKLEEILDSNLTV
jgi:transcriptional regulator with XRE-family HTH domain